MIVFSENKSFQLRKYVDGQRSQKEEFGETPFHTLKDYEYFRVKSRDTKILIRSMWPVFRGAPGIQPFGNSYIYPDSMYAVFKNYGKAFYINDWNRPLEVNTILPILPNETYDDDFPMIVSLSLSHIIYDTLNIKDVYDGQYADYSLYMNVEVAQ